MNVAEGQTSAPTLRVPRRVPRAVRLSPEFISKVSGSLKLTLEEEGTTLGLLWGTTTDGLVTVRSFWPFSSEARLSAAKHQAPAAEDFVTKLLPLAKTETEVPGGDVIGWIAFGSKTLPDVEIRSQNRHFRRASDIALVFRPDRNLNVSGEVYIWPFSTEPRTDTGQHGRVDFSAASPPAEPLEISFYKPIDPTFYLRVYQATDAFASKDSKLARLQEFLASALNLRSRRPATHIFETPRDQINSPAPTILAAPSDPALRIASAPGAWSTQVAPNEPEPSARVAPAAVPPAPTAPAAATPPAAIPAEEVASALPISQAPVSPTPLPIPPAAIPVAAKPEPVARVAPAAVPPAPAAPAPLSPTTAPVVPAAIPPAVALAEVAPSAATAAPAPISRVASVVVTPAAAESPAQAAPAAVAPTAAEARSGIADAPAAGKARSKWIVLALPAAGLGGVLLGVLLAIGFGPKFGGSSATKQKEDVSAAYVPNSPSLVKSSAGTPLPPPPSVTGTTVKNSSETTPAARSALVTAAETSTPGGSKKKTSNGTALLNPRQLKAQSQTPVRSTESETQTTLPLSPTPETIAAAQLPPTGAPVVDPQLNVPQIPSSPLPAATNPVPSPAQVLPYAAPRPIRQVAPVVQGSSFLIFKDVTVEIEVNVNAQGRVTAVRPVPSTDKVGQTLVGAALKAAEEWRFEPAMIRGQAAEGKYTIAFRFHPRR